VAWGAQMNPTLRPSADALYSHHFLETACDPSVVQQKLQAIFIFDNLADGFF
jgi:hypothetical protein